MVFALARAEGRAHRASRGASQQMPGVGREQRSVCGMRSVQSVRSAHSVPSAPGRSSPASSAPWPAPSACPWPHLRPGNAEAFLCQTAGICGRGSKPTPWELPRRPAKQAGWRCQQGRAAQTQPSSEYGGNCSPCRPHFIGKDKKGLWLHPPGSKSICRARALSPAHPHTRLRERRRLDAPLAHPARPPTSPPAHPPGSASTAAHTLLSVFSMSSALIFHSAPSISSERWRSTASACVSRRRRRVRVVRQEARQEARGKRQEAREEASDNRQDARQEARGRGKRQGTALLGACSPRSCLRSGGSAWTLCRASRVFTHESARMLGLGADPVHPAQRTQRGPSTTNMAPARPSARGAPAPASSRRAPRAPGSPS